MPQQMTLSDRCQGALYGMFIGDGLAMPVHWYYDTLALKQDYGVVAEYMSPKNPHPDSILWRSSYTPPNAKADILHDQAQYWGKKGVHYHQFLKKGENTLNAKLAAELINLLIKDNSYDQRVWLNHLATYMTTSGNHNDTYVEEYLRHFFTNYAQGKQLEECGRQDENHIGGLTLMLPLLLYYAKEPDKAKQIALEHLSLTHGGTLMHEAGSIVADLILGLLSGKKFEECLEDVRSNRTYTFAGHDYTALLSFPDHVVLGSHFTIACYVNGSIPATLYLALKYKDDPRQALIVNTNAGGDNVGRGAVLGAILGAMHGIDCWPESWIKGLKHPPSHTICKKEV